MLNENSNLNIETKYTISSQSNAWFIFEKSKIVRQSGKKKNKTNKIRITGKETKKKSSK